MFLYGPLFLLIWPASKAFYTPEKVANSPCLKKGPFSFEPEVKCHVFFLLVNYKKRGLFTRLETEKTFIMEEGRGRKQR